MENSAHDQTSLTSADQEHWHNLLYGNHHDKIAIEALTKEYRKKAACFPKSKDLESRFVPNETRSVLPEPKPKTFFNRDTNGVNFVDVKCPECLEKKNESIKERRILVALVKSKKRNLKRFKGLRNKENMFVKGKKMDQCERDECGTFGKACEDLQLPELQQVTVVSKRPSKPEVKKVVVQMPHITIDKPGIINECENAGNRGEKISGSQDCGEENGGNDFDRQSLGGNGDDKEDEEEEEEEVFPCETSRKAKELETFAQNAKEQTYRKEKLIQIFERQDFKKEMFSLPGEGLAQISQVSFVDYTETSHSYANIHRKTLKKTQVLPQIETCYFCKREKENECSNGPEDLINRCSYVRKQCSAESRHKTTSEEESQTDLDSALFTMEELCERHRATIKNLKKVLHPRGFRGSIHTCPLQRTLDHSARRINLQKYNSVDLIYKAISEERRKQREPGRRRAKSETGQFLDCDRIQHTHALSLPPIMVVPAEKGKSLQKHSALQQHILRSREARPDSNDSGIGE